MKIIALDSSGLVATVAVMTEDVLIAEYTVNHKKTHSQTLLPMLDEIVKMSETDMGDIDAIAISEGPGSFTGLRIGSATAKGLGLALDKPLVSVPTLEALAYNFEGTEGVLICPLMDARRSQVYTGLYEFNRGDLTTHVEQCAIPVTEIIEKVNSFGRKVIYLGDGVEAYKGILEDATKVEFSFAPAALSKQKAGSVGSLALRMLAEGKTQSADDHVPVYLRLSQAERELAEKQKAESGE